MTKFKNKYRAESHRMPHWDYSGNGWYFITPVTQNRVCNLGKIENGKMALSDFGEIVKKEWLKSFEIRNELFCDEYIIMPNHLHAIVVLNKNGLDGTDDWDKMYKNDGVRGTHVVETHGRASLQRASSDQSQSSRQSQPEFTRKPQSISSFIAGFKSAINSKIDDYIDENHLNIPKYNRKNHFFQPNYHDHIIRNANEYERIKNYIIDNPKNWKEDGFNGE